MKEFLRTSFITRGLYQNLKKLRDSRRYRDTCMTPHVFADRIKHSQTACLILAGYKSYLYGDVFGRIMKYMPEGIDVCLISSGLYSEELANIAKEQGWSYLSTERNCVTLAQNVALKRYTDAEYIYKIDEDIFTTQGCFEALMETYKQVEEHGEYAVGFTAPLIPVNGYGHKRILEKLGLEDVYEERFEKSRYMSGSDRMIENNGETARFFWGDGGSVPSVDQLNRRWRELPFEYSVCPIRFSIGFILFKRSLWEEMGMFPVIKGNPCMGMDEEYLCSYCMLHSRAIVIAENTVAGHLAFGPQNESMKAYYREHPEVFHSRDESKETT